MTCTFLNFIGQVQEPFQPEFFLLSLAACGTAVFCVNTLSRPKHCYSLSELRKTTVLYSKCHNRNVASMVALGRLPLPAKCIVLKGISSLECFLFSHCCLPMNSGHSCLQIDWIGKVGRSSLLRFGVNVGVTENWQQMAVCVVQAFVLLILLPFPVCHCFSSKIIALACVLCASLVCKQSVVLPLTWQSRDQTVTFHYADARYNTVCINTASEIFIKNIFKNTESKVLH